MIAKAAECAVCSGVLDAEHYCANCRSAISPVRGVVGEAMPGSIWTGEVEPNYAEIRKRMIFAVVKGDALGPNASGPRVYVQGRPGVDSEGTPRVHAPSYAGDHDEGVGDWFWVMTSTHRVLQACVLGLLGRVNDLEWLLAGRRSRCDKVVAALRSTTLRCVRNAGHEGPCTAQHDLSGK